MYVTHPYRQLTEGKDEKTQATKSEIRWKKIFIKREGIWNRAVLCAACDCSFISYLMFIDRYIYMNEWMNVASCHMQTEKWKMPFSALFCIHYYYDYYYLYIESDTTSFLGWTFFVSFTISFKHTEIFLSFRSMSARISFHFFSFHFPLFFRFSL